MSRWLSPNRIRNTLVSVLARSMVQIGRAQAGQDRPTALEVLADQGSIQVAHADVAAQLQEIDVRLAGDLQSRQIFHRHLRSQTGNQIDARPPF